MSDGVKSEISSDIDQNYALNSADPKNVQELTIYVSKCVLFTKETKNTRKKKLNELTQTQCMNVCFASIIISFFVKHFQFLTLHPP